MDNLILCFFCHWNSLPSWTDLLVQQELSNRLILCWGRHFTWKQHLGNTSLTYLYSGEAPFQMCYLFWSGGSNLKVSFNFECHKGMPKWCETAVFPQVSTQSMNATMKVNGKLWTLALGFKEGLSLGDGTSAQSTWGVNSVWSSLNNWCEEWRPPFFFVLKWRNLTH